MPLFTKKITPPPMTPEEARDAKEFEAYKLQQRTTAAREKYWNCDKNKSRGGLANWGPWERIFSGLKN
ncbi:hypothetical protein ONS95_001365 [Cadophora gregata]|uniref:uncharacterized protein n=1 Tax=Cadophora gregata TaxID=51156 RepID=UPI0026DDB3B1|nr:uncharacterized protein ONS95_001365 [Cadophora gregata]KAK0110984.1 hypothetical protein ONS95_001365 [Cadophora gregata]KAK0112557.1 hypothetical protein ONS96_001792 [Cadophora gregata f. sp. sojae]